MDARFKLYEKQIEKLIEQKQLQVERIERIRKSLERKESYLYNYGKNHFKLDWNAFKKLQEKYERNMLMKRLNLSSPIQSSQVHQQSSVFDSPQSSYDSKISVTKVAHKTKTPASTQIDHDEQKMIEILEDFEESVLKKKRKSKYEYRIFMKDYLPRTQSQLFIKQLKDNCI